MNYPLSIMNYELSFKYKGELEGVERDFIGGSVRFTPPNPLSTPYEPPMNPL